MTLVVWGVKTPLYYNRSPASLGRAPISPGPLGHRLALILLPKNHKYSKKISVHFYPIWTPFDICFLRNKKHASDRNWHWALDQYVSPKNNIKSCQKVYESEQYWHGTIKNYRYDGDVSTVHYVQVCISLTHTHIGGGRARREEVHARRTQSRLSRSEERRVGKECRSRWSPYH